MKTSIFHCAAAVVAIAFAHTAVHAAQPAGGEYQRQQNVQQPRDGTHASRQAERQAQRANVKAQARNGELPETGDDWGMNGNRPAAAAGTHQTRAAERREKRAEITQAVKDGEMPVTNEAVVNQPAKTP